MVKTAESRHWRGVIVRDRAEVAFMLADPYQINTVDSSHKGLNKHGQSSTGLHGSAGRRRVWDWAGWSYRAISRILSDRAV